jgi:hypothetical protein
MKPSDKFMHLTQVKSCSREGGLLAINPADVIGWWAHEDGTEVRYKIESHCGDKYSYVSFAIVAEFPHEVENEFNRAMS